MAQGKEVEKGKKPGAPAGIGAVGGKKKKKTIGKKSVK
jgi:hypothetical protein